MLLLSTAMPLAVAVAQDTLPPVSDPGTSSRVETTGSFGFRECTYGVGQTTCTGPPPPPAVTADPGHSQSAETADTQTLSLSDSYDPTHLGGHLIGASSSAETALGVNRANVSAAGSYAFTRPARSTTSLPATAT